MSESKILVIDDDPDVRFILQTALTRLRPNDKIFVAENCHQALKLLHEHKFRLVICDYALPDGNGVSVLNHPKISGYKVGISGNESVSEFKQCCDKFIPKPFEIPVIKEVCEKIREN
jgi:DNA-binding NtrC family response regulator